jgi:N-acetylmuramoyl-L-alanine amidase
MRVVMSHHGAGSSLSDRAHLSNTIGADLFLSIHCNAAEASGAHGFEVWTSPGQTGADTAAKCIYEDVDRTFPELWGRCDLSDDDVDKEARFYVLTHTLAPAVLVEMAFITNFSEEILLSTDVWRWRYADAIVRGVFDWFSVNR